MPKARLSASARGYGWRHQQERDRWRPVVESGNSVCAEVICTNPAGRRIQPGTPWDLAHDRTTGAYRGPAHAGCNRSEAATHRNRKHGYGRTRTTAPTTTTGTGRNSRDW